MIRLRKINIRMILLLAALAVFTKSMQAQEDTVKHYFTTTVQVKILKADEAAIFSVLDTFITYFRQPLSENLQKHLSTYHFPHVRIASGNVTVIPSADAVTAEQWLARLPADWDHSEWVSRNIVQASRDKVHVLTIFRRFRKDNTVIADETSLYILEKINGKWGIRGRSSYAK